MKLSGIVAAVTKLPFLYPILGLLLWQLPPASAQVAESGYQLQDIKRG